MSKVYIENGKAIDLDNLKILSTTGSEVVVYHDNDLVYKIFRDDYKFDHKTAEELDYLSSLNTSRILMPKAKLFRDDELIGYTMEFVSSNNNLLRAPMSHLLDELAILQNDVDIISKAGVRLIDTDRLNYVCGDGIYLVDCGNFKIDDLSDMFYDVDGHKHLIDNDSNCLIPVDNSEDYSESYFIKKWNCSKINALLCEMLFMNNPDIDLCTLRGIIEFFKEKRVSKNELSDYETYKQYFNQNLPVGSAVIEFIDKNIHIDEQERDKILSLMER